MEKPQSDPAVATPIEEGKADPSREHELRAPEDRRTPRREGTHAMKRKRPVQHCRACALEGHRSELEVIKEIAVRTGLSIDTLIGRTPMPTDALRARAQRHAGELRHLVGCTIEALEFYDSDDGHNALVRAGILAEFKRIEAQYEEAGQEPAQ